MNVRKLILLLLAFLLLTGCQSGKQQPTVQPTQEGPVPYVAPVQPVTGNPNSLYPAFIDGNRITWSQAIALINNGEVMKITVSQSLETTLFLKDGRSLLTQQPAAGELQKVLDACGAACKDIEVTNQ